MHMVLNHIARLPFNNVMKCIIIVTESIEITIKPTFRSKYSLKPIYVRHLDFY